MENKVIKILPADLESAQNFSKNYFAYLSLLLTKINLKEIELFVQILFET